MDTASTSSEIDLGAWPVTEESVSRYLAAVGDAQQAYFDHRLAPPMALSAWALGALLDHLALAPGAVHSLQEVTTLRPVGFGGRISGVARLEQPRRRGGLEFTTVSYILTDEAGAAVQTGKTTVLVPASGAAAARDA